MSEVPQNSEISEQKSNKEKEVDPIIVQHNLTMLETDMVNLLNSESIGGSAGTVEIDNKEYSCGAANGYFDAETGKIVAFGNIQHVDQDIVRKNTEFTLKVAVSDSLKFFKIINFYPRWIKNRPGFKNIEKAIQEYNTRNTIHENDK